jgi:hypothetical protein
LEHHLGVELMSGLSCVVFVQDLSRRPTCLGQWDLKELLN